MKRGASKYLSTHALGDFIKNLYEKLRPAAENDGLFRPLTITFASGTPRNQPGEFCYSDDNGYHYGSVGERGETCPEKTTKDLLEISYWVLKGPIQSMSSHFENKNRVRYQDPRRVWFPKVIQFFELLGDDYKQRAELDQSKTWNKYPYNDNIVLCRDLVEDFERIASLLMDQSKTDTMFFSRFSFTCNRCIHYFTEMNYREKPNIYGSRKAGGIPKFDKVFETMLRKFRVIADELGRKDLPESYGGIIDEVKEIERHMALVRPI